MLACLGVAVIASATARAATYKMVLCAAGNGTNGYDTATNTRSPQSPNGIFNFENHCVPAPYPAGDNAYLRIAENQDKGSAGPGAYGSMSWTVPPYVSITAAGGYTRERESFNAGWRGRFWGEDFGGGGHHILIQAQGMPNQGFTWGPTSVFASHLWPFGGYGDYRRFIFELTCGKEAPERCDNTGLNAVDANTLVLTLNDVQDSKVAFTNGSALMGGGWVRGTQAVTWNVSDVGSGLRWEHLFINGAERFRLDHAPACDLGSSQPTGEFARRFSPCPTGGPYAHTTTLDTASVPDGARPMQVCAEDYGQAVNPGPESCDARTVHVDNTAPGAPSGLRATSSNPARYLDHFGAQFSLPPNEGSPITKVHYSVVDPSGKTLVPERTQSATDPTKLEGIEGPKAPGDYRLRVWLEDAVGLIGSAATAPIPHDTTPPAAPQSLAIAAPQTARSADAFDLRWHNLPDLGSSIEAAHYEIRNSRGDLVVKRAVHAQNVERIDRLDAPPERGRYTLSLWLADAEGNVGAPIQAPLSYECPRSRDARGLTLSTALGESRAQTAMVSEERGAILSGAVQSIDGPLSAAAVCVFSRVVTDPERQFLGVAMTDSMGAYRFELANGPSRELTAVYRPDQREVSEKALLLSQVRPTFRALSRVVRNGSSARFSGEIPGPHNDQVLVVLQVKSGKGWRAFRRYRTREGGRFSMRYRFTQTTAPTTYVMRAQVRSQGGYPYEQGNSRPLRLRVRP